jgi:hypothetical protein
MILQDQAEIAVDLELGQKHLPDVIERKGNLSPFRHAPQFKPGAWNGNRQQVTVLGERAVAARPRQLKELERRFKSRWPPFFNRPVDVQCPDGLNILKKPDSADRTGNFHVVPGLGRSLGIPEHELAILAARDDPGASGNTPQPPQFLSRSDQPSRCLAGSQIPDTNGLVGTARNQSLIAVGELNSTDPAVVSDKRFSDLFAGRHVENQDGVVTRTGGRCGDPFTII